MLLVAGGMLVNSLASSIMAARELQRTLEQNVESRTAQLANALQSIKDMERTALKLTENIPVGTYVLETNINNDIHFTFVSDRLLKIVGASRQSILADTKVLFRNIYADDYPDFVASMNAALADRTPHRWTGRGLVKGEVRWLRLEANPRFIDDGTVLWEGVVTDITDLKAAEAALKKASDDLLAIEIERTRLEEREIMLRDMHDGFGSQLASLRFLVAERTIDRQHLTVALNECIADLYLVIDTLGAKENTLRDAMADFRFRTARRLAELPLAITGRSISKKFRRRRSRRSCKSCASCRRRSTMCCSTHRPEPSGSRRSIGLRPASLWCASPTTASASRSRCDAGAA